MIPAGDFVLNASLVPGRLTYHLDRGGWSHWLEYEATVFWGAEAHLIRYIKGIAERLPRSFIFGGGRGKQLVCRFDDTSYNMNDMTMMVTLIMPYSGDIAGVSEKSTLQTRSVTTTWCWAGPGMGMLDRA